MSTTSSPKDDRVIELFRHEVKPHLAKLQFNDEFLFNEDFLNKYDSCCINDKKNNLVRVRYGPAGIDVIETNDIEYAMKKNRHWNCDWIIIKPDPTPVYEIRRVEE